jgi:hypothetical protein
LETRTNGAKIEKKALKLGYMPLSDCLPLLIAQDKGFFNQEGLKVELQMVMRSLFQMRCIVNFLNSTRPSLIKQLP